MSTATRPMPGAITGPTVPSWLPALTLVAGIALVALLATSSSPNNPAGTTATGVTPVPHTVSVTGTGHAFLTPDVAELRLGVLVQRTTVRDARDAAATASTAVVAALRAAGIAEADIQTSTLSLQPIYNYATDKTKPTITGYELRNGLTITIRNLDLIGKAIDDSIKAGATTVDSVTFDVTDKTAGQRDARKAAVADARARADTLVGAAGSKITGVQSISESVSTPTWPTRYYNAIDSGGSSTPVLPGVNELVVNVSIVYLIE